MVRGSLAQQTADVVVTAGISSAVTIRVCDTTADFGIGLNAFGGVPTGTTDTITLSERGDLTQGQGTIYLWHPSCSAGQRFLEIESTLPWQLHSCATENGGSSSISVSQGDLRFGVVDYSSPPSYAEAEGFHHFTPGCHDASSGGGSGFYSYLIGYKLRVDVDDTQGSFNATTSFMPVT
jgi:hypothetical protein